MSCWWEIWLTSGIFTLKIYGYKSSETGQLDDVILHPFLSFLTYETEFVLFLAVLGNSVLPMGWDSSHATLNNDVRTLNFRSDITFAPLQNKKPKSLCDVKCQKRKEWQIINNNFNVIGKKNNQTLVSDADREIPTLWSTDNAGNSVNLVSGIILLPSGWDLSVCIGDQKRFYLSEWWKGEMKGSVPWKAI